MNLDSGVSLGQLLLALGVMLTTGGIAWGALIQRVNTLEKEVETLSGFDKRLITIEQQSIYMVKEIDKITGSWLFREPAVFDAMERPTSPGRRRGSAS